MYELLRRPERRPWSTPADWLTVGPEAFAEDGEHVAVKMQENRAPFGQDERRAITIIAAMFAAIGLISLSKGFWPVPVICAVVFAALAFALQSHRKVPPPSESLEFLGDRVRHRDRFGHIADWDGRQLSLTRLERSPADLRLILGEPGRTREIGTCLSLTERCELAAIVSATLQQNRRSRS